MKLPPRIFRIEWDLHAWVGVISSLLLFVIFFTGVFALFHLELQIWQEPALRGPPAAEGRALPWQRMYDTVDAQVGIPPDTRVAFITAEETRGVGVVLIAPDGGEQTWFVDPDTLALRPSASHLAEELYHLHFIYQVPGGIQVAGIAGVGLLVVVISGLLVHLRDLRGQLWRFRPWERLRFSASDAHKVLGVFGLPFVLVMSWSGASLALWGTITYALAEASLDGDAIEAQALRSFPSLDRPATGEAVPMQPLDAIVAAGREAAGAEGEPEYLDLRAWGDASAWTRVYWHTDALEPRRWAFVEGATGDVLVRSEQADTLAGWIDQILFDLHFAHFGGLLTRMAYVVLGLGGCVVIVTGNLVWLERRDRRRASRGNRVLERATLGVCGGLVLACAVALALNVALPVDLPGRAELEVAGLFGSWLAFAALAQVPRWTPRQLLATGSAVAGALYLALVAAELLRSGPGALTTPWASLNLLFLALGATSCGIAGWAWPRALVRGTVPSVAVRAVEQD